MAFWVPINAATCWGTGFGCGIAFAWVLNGLASFAVDLIEAAAERRRDREFAS